MDNLIVKKYYLVYLRPKNNAIIVTHRKNITIRVLKKNRCLSFLGVHPFFYAT